MAPTQINIQSSSTLSQLAERAQLILNVTSSLYEQAEASKNVVTTAHNIQNQLNELCPRSASGDISPDAPVSFYSIASLSTSNDDEYDDDNNKTGKRLYTATTKVDIRFRDFKTLGDMVVDFSTMEFIRLQGITWKLTDEKKAQLEEEVRLEALRSAIKRAHAYAKVIGKENVTAAKITDNDDSYTGGRTMQTARRYSAAPGVGIDFEPQIVEVRASLEVEFHAE